MTCDSFENVNVDLLNESCHLAQVDGGLKKIMFNCIHMHVASTLFTKHLIIYTNCLISNDHSLQLAIS